jgi:hypothetical protein
MKGISLVIVAFALAGCAAEAQDPTTETTGQDQAALEITKVAQLVEEPGIGSTIGVREVANPVDRPSSAVTHSGHPSHAPPDGAGAVENSDKP